MAAPVMPPAPSAAAAAGAAAAALLQRQLAVDGGSGRGALPNGGWTEHQTGDGRKFYFHEETQTSTWEKPEVLMSPEERANDTAWGEYRIWDGRVFYHNKDTKVSCWRMPPELRKMREGISGIDDRPLPLTNAEKRRAFLDLLKDRDIGVGYNFHTADERVAEDPHAEALTESQRKQCFAEILGMSMRQDLIDAREKQRNAANALERLIEERFARPEDSGVTYEEARKLLQHEEAWQLMKSDIRRNEVFQTIMERLEEKHKKVRAEKRTERVVRLQRFIGSDPELKRSRLRWKDAVAILAKRDELQDDEPPLETLRVWSSLRDLKQASEHEAESKAKNKPDPFEMREERRRRDNFRALLKEMTQRGKITPNTSWRQYEGVAENEMRFSAMREGRGATAMELYDEFQDELRSGAIQGLVYEPKDELEDIKKEEDEDKFEPPMKRQRFDARGPNDAAQAAAQAAAAAITARSRLSGGQKPEEMSALDALIASADPPASRAAAAAAAAAGVAANAGAGDSSSSEDDDEDDPLMGLANAAAAAKKAEAQARDAAAAAGGAAGAAAALMAPAGGGDSSDTESSH